MADPFRHDLPNLLSKGVLMKLIDEFKEFAMKGSVVDLAVGVVIGGAFSSIVNSFVGNVIMPPINLITAKFGIDFKNAAYTIYTESPKLDAAGKIIEGEGAEMIKQDYPVLAYGPFVQTIVEFLLIAIALFIAIKIMNTARAKMEGEKEVEAEKVPADIALLTEIRDALKKA